MRGRVLFEWWSMKFLWRAAWGMLPWYAALPECAVVTLRYTGRIARAVMPPTASR